jgi:hypothetical protein
MGVLRGELRNKWAALGYSRDMGSAAVVPPPPEQFLRVYHICGAEHAISDVSFSRLKVARIGDLNDPFELMALNFREKRTRETVRTWKGNYGAENGLLCFSSDWTNPVLWTHYGERHHGVCLGFNLLREYAEPVSYEAERLSDVLDHRGAAQLTLELQRQLLRTKFKHWQYEREVRRFVPLKDVVVEGGLHFYEFNETLVLAEIILGVSCSLDARAVRALAANSHRDVNVIRARLMHKGFNIVPDESSW